ncbi:MAG: two-component system sensor histidine kinase NtrB [Candidatus Binataceae bacterium]
MILWREIVDSLPDGILVLTANLKPRAVNAAANTMLGASKVTPQVVAELLRQNDWLGKMVRLCFDTAQTLGDPETVLRMGSRSIPIHAQVSPVVDSSGTPEAAIVVLHDLSHQRTAEYAFGPGEPVLKLSSAGLAHEVKNPLTGIKGAAELLASLNRNEPRAQQYCDVILDGVNRIATLVEQVLSVSAPQRLAHDRVNIHQLLHQALGSAGLFPRPPAGVSVVHQFDPSLPDVVGDAAALERVFVNLFRNAHEAIGPSGTIWVRTRMETEFRMTSKGRRRSFLRVDVSDSGGGLSEDQAKQLFTPFFTTKPTGTGLGLVLSQRIVALHGGRLWAERGGAPVGRGGEERSRGMTFKLTLPVVDGALGA